MGSTTAHFFLPRAERARKGLWGDGGRVNVAQRESRETTPGAIGRAAALHDLVQRTVSGMGYELVEMERAGRGLLRVTLDFAPGRTVAPGRAAQIAIEDCERVSRQLTNLFAVEGVAYDRLEVSSPGMDRPLRTAQDYARFAGEMVNVHLQAPIDGRRKVRGRLLGLCGDAQSPRARVLPVPPPQAGGAKRTRKAAQEDAVEFALVDVEKARLAPEWDFDRDAMQRAAQEPTI